VFDLFASHPQQNFFPVVDNAGLPLGLIHEREIKHLVYSDFGRDLARNKSLRPDLQRFIRPAPVAEVGASAEHLLELLASSGIGEALVITENLRYAGVLSPTALLKIIAERKIRIAEDRNPLTGMPGNTAIADFVASSIGENGTTRLLCYFDFDHFKPFNDAYGFPFGDKAILLFSRLMREHFMDQRHFTAHIGGDDFFAGLVGIPAEEARGLINALLSHFARDMAELYTVEDRVAGYIQGNDRGGNPTRFPLIRCSCAVLELAPNYLSTDSDVVSRLLGTMKGKAKKSPDGLAWHILTTGAPAPAH
jgi:diguanylate cyclase (GGDEF)-like protein